MVKAPTTWETVLQDGSVPLSDNGVEEAKDAAMKLKEN